MDRAGPHIEERAGLAQPADIVQADADNPAFRRIQTAELGGNQNANSR